MAKHIVLPGEQWADFRDGEEVTEKHRRKILTKNADLARAVKAIENGDDPERILSAAELQGVNEAQDALIIALLKGWSYELPLSEESLLELPGKAYDQLKKESAPEIGKILPDFSVDTDPDSPTVPSNE